MNKWIGLFALLFAAAFAQNGYEKALDIDIDYEPFALTRSNGLTLLGTQGKKCFWGGTPAQLYSVDEQGNLSELFRSTNPINLRWCHSGPYIWVAGQYQYGDVMTQDFVVYRFTPGWQPVDTLQLQLPSNSFFLGMGKAEDGGVHLLFQGFLLKIGAAGQGIVDTRNYNSFGGSEFSYMKGKFWCRETDGGLSSIDTLGTTSRTRMHTNLQYLQTDTTHQTLIVATPDSLCWYDSQLNRQAAYRLPIGTDSLLSLNIQGDTVVLGARLFGALHLLSYSRSQGVLHAPVFTMGLTPGKVLLEPNGDMLLAANNQPTVLRTYRQGQWYTTGYAAKIDRVDIDKVEYEFYNHIPGTDYTIWYLYIYSTLKLRNTGTEAIDSIYVRNEISEYNYIGSCNEPNIVGPIRFSPPLLPGDTISIEANRLKFAISPGTKKGTVFKDYFQVILPNKHWNNDLLAPVPVSFTYTSRSSGLSTLPLQAYPNPATTYLTVAGEARGATLHLRSADGRLLHSQSYTPGLRIDLSPYASGLYLLEVVGRNGVYRERVVKQ